MKIAAIQSGPPRRQLPARPAARREKTASGRGKIRHVLHGWRSLTAPLLAQVLELCSLRAAAASPQEALEAYRRAQTRPAAPRLIRDI